MLGTFSSGQMPCAYSGQIHRLHIYEDGEVELLQIQPGFTRSWTARGSSCPSEGYDLLLGRAPE